MMIAPVSPLSAASLRVTRTRSTRKLEPILAILIALAVALTFWSQQRYPALLKKLHAGNQIKVAGAISFDALLKVTPAQPAWERVGRTSVNWLYTNRFGMYFAVPFGAALMTLMASTARPKRFASPGANVLCGAVAGAPMGVCTNCATPVAQSLLSGGASTRLTLAAMISSPSFNPLVVAMVFALFPLPLALLRMGVPVALLALLPWLVQENSPFSFDLTMPELELSINQRLRQFSLAYGRNFARLLWMTLPWMLAAALLGALVAEMIPAYGTHLPVSVAGVIGVAALGTLLPVPMALDVALSYVLFHAGVPLPYVAALLCTLGPVSIYSLLAMGKQLGRKTGVHLALGTAALGTVAGLSLLWFPLR